MTGVQTCALPILSSAENLFDAGHRVNRRPNRKPLSDYQRFLNRRRSAARARVEHVFHVVKRLWGFNKVRYRGLAKNTARLFTAFALANLYLLRRRLLPVQGRCAW